MLSDPRIIFGVHSFTPYDRSDLIPYGMSLVVGNSNFALSGEIVSLQGGSNRYDWANEDGAITAELSLLLRQYEDWQFNLFLGGQTTKNAGQSLGTARNLTNAKNATVVDPVGGIGSIAVKAGKEADLKFGKFIIKAVSATEIDVYLYTNVDFNRGAELNILSDDLKIFEAITIPVASAVELLGLGVELTGGTGPLAMNPGDTASFEILPPDSESSDIIVGGNSDEFPEFGAICVAQKRGSQEMFTLDIFKLKAIGMPIGFTEKAFSEAEITARASYDSSKNGVFSAISIKPL